MDTNPQARLSPAARDRLRLALALQISVALHLVLIYGLQYGSIERGAPPRAPVIEARLTPLPSSDVPTQVLVKAVDAPVPAEVPDWHPPASPALPAPQETPPEDEAYRPGMPEQAASPTTLDVPLPADPTYYPAREVDEHPVLLSGARPVYPPAAAAANVRGEVMALFLLNEHGIVDDVSIVEVKPPDYPFGEAVEAWLRNARFKPAMRMGRAVKARVVYRVNFEP